MRQRFLLLYHPRCGSNLIAATLSTHPAIVMHGELFHHLETVRQMKLFPGESATASSQVDYYRDGSDPVAFLQAELYNRDFPPEKTAVGFKMCHYHMRWKTNARLCNLTGVNPGIQLPSHEVLEERFWSWLSAERDIRVISLYRRSVLQVLVSTLKAVKSNQWWLPLGVKPDSVGGARFHIPVEEFREVADLMTSARERACALLADHPLLSLEYQEDVVGRFDMTMRRIEDFLGVDPLPVRPQLQKQAQLPVSEAVENYAELRAAVAGTKYESAL